jgi:hypothetical protein
MDYVGGGKEMEKPLGYKKKTYDNCYEISSCNIWHLLWCIGLRSGIC